MQSLWVQLMLFASGHRERRKRKRKKKNRVRSGLAGSWSGRAD